GLGDGNRRADAGGLDPCEGWAVGYVQIDVYSESLVPVGRYRHPSGKALARPGGHRGHLDWNSRRATFQSDGANPQPRLIAAGVCVDRRFFLGFDADRLLQAVADAALEVNRLRADLDEGRRGQAKRFEELLHAADSRRGRALNGIGPAVVFVPALDSALLE